MVSPEFGVFHHPGFTEYRVENWWLARDGSGRVVSGVSGWTWQYSLLPLLAALVWPRVRCKLPPLSSTEHTQVHDSIALLSGLILILVYLIYFKCTQVLFGMQPSYGLLPTSQSSLPRIRHCYPYSRNSTGNTSRPTLVLPLRRDASIHSSRITPGLCHSRRTTGMERSLFSGCRQAIWFWRLPTPCRI